MQPGALWLCSDSLHLVLALLTSWAHAQAGSKG